MSEPSRVNRVDLAIVAIVAALANFLYLYYSNGDYFYPDSITYLTPARNLLHGLGFVGELGVVETTRTPAYPLFLAPFLAMSSSVVPILIAQHLMNVFVSVATYTIAFHTTRQRFVALLAALIVATDTASIHHANRVLTEAPFTAALIIVFAMAIRLMERPAMRLAIAIGLLAGLLVLIRPVAIAYFAVLAVCIGARPLRIAVAIILCGLVLPLGWMLRNKMETHVFTLTTISGTNMLQHRAAPALAILDDYDFLDALKDRQSELQDAADDEIQQRLHVPDAQDLDPAVRGRYYAEIGRRVALQHPIGLALTIVRGTLVNLFDSNWSALADVTVVPESIVELALNAWTAAVIAFACVGVVVLAKRERQFVILLAATVTYFIVISAGSEAEARFRVPVMPMIAIAAATGLQRLKPVASCQLPVAGNQQPAT